MRIGIHILLGILLALSAAHSVAGIAPYPLDAATLHLWHLDEAAGAANCTDAVSVGVTLAAITNGATMGNVALPGFGSSASTYDAGSISTKSNPSGCDAYLGPLTFVNGLADNSLITCAGTNGAFTIEALVRVDFNPANQSVSPDTSRYMQIVSAEAEETVRLFQFRVGWTSVNDPTPELQFININTGGSVVQTLAAVIPTTGTNAMVQGNWYHVAVTYNGQPNSADNLKLYWTKVETNRIQANLLASLLMTNNLAVASADWGIGNEGRGASDANWVGLIDEVRLSSVARGANEFIFSGADTDNDGLPDEWEMANFLSLAQGAGDDPDGDGFTNLQEFQGGSNPTVKASTPNDKDADELPDVWENYYFGSLTQGPADDFDADGFNNLQEFQAGTNPANALSNLGDTDSDGLPDAWEIANFGSLVQGAADDSDGDGFTNLQEYRAGTNPADANSVPPGPRVRFIPIEDGDTNTSEYAYADEINSVSFIRSGLLTVSNQQFMTYYGRHQTDPSYAFNNKLWVARRTVGSNLWEVFRTTFTPVSIADAHDSISFAIDGEGYMHLSWGMHGDALRYAKSTTPVTGSGPIAFGPNSPMTGRENSVTYPQFLTLPDGDLLYLFREGSSGNGDLFLNRYSLATHTWSNVHTNGTNQMTFIKGSGWTPNYNAYWQMPCLDAAGNLFLTWTWRYNGDSPTGETSYQSNHDFAYAHSTNSGLTWLRQNEIPYALPISEKGESGDTNTMAEKILSIPEGSSLMNQAGMCLDLSGQPVIVDWWAAGAVTNDHRRQYHVAFPAPGGWQVRQVSWRTIDSPTNKTPVADIGDMGRPTILCDKADRLIVIYRDNQNSNGLTVVHSLPRAQDPNRLVWTAFDLTTDNLGIFDAPLVDLARWQESNSVNILYHPENGEGYTAPANTASPISVLEWDAAAYFNHRPSLRLSLTNNAARLSWPAQPGWGYQLQFSTNLSSWSTVTTANNSVAWSLEHTVPSPSATAVFWRLEIREGAF